MFRNLQEYPNVQIILVAYRINHLKQTLCHYHITVRSHSHCHFATYIACQDRSCAGLRTSSPSGPLAKDTFLGGGFRWLGPYRVLGGALCKGLWIPCVRPCTDSDGNGTPPGWSGLWGDGVCRTIVCDALWHGATCNNTLRTL